MAEAYTHPVALIYVHGRWHLGYLALITKFGEDPTVWWCEPNGSAICEVGETDRVFSLSELENK